MKFPSLHVRQKEALGYDGDGSNQACQEASLSLLHLHSWFVQSHLLLRSRDRRFHYSGETKVFTVRNARHSAGFDEEGSLRIF